MFEATVENGGFVRLLNEMILLELSSERLEDTTDRCLTEMQNLIKRREEMLEELLRKLNIY
ncbi:MAG: hypothetical protein QW735_04275 [archaeon]